MNFHDLQKTCKYVATTPTVVNDAIRAFCRQLSNEEPVFLKVTPVPDASVAQCYANAFSEAERISGKPVYGWLIWELPGVYLTAEHHAVIERDGKLIDISPQVHGETTVLFVPDLITEFRPPGLANRYASLVSNPLVARYVEIARRNTELDLAGKTYGLEYMLNDSEMTRLLDRFLSQTNSRKASKAGRKRKKEERRRKKQGRRPR